MEYEVEREYGQYHVREKGQLTRGTTLTDAWLQQMGFWPLSRLNIDAAINATMASVGGAILDKTRPKDYAFRAGFKSYPTRGPKQRMRIPERMLIRSGR